MDGGQLTDGGCLQAGFCRSTGKFTLNEKDSIYRNEVDILLVPGSNCLCSNGTKVGRQNLRFNKPDALLLSNADA